MGIKSIKIETPQELIKQISLDNYKLFSPINTFIFRGQANSKWNLIPTIFRKNVKLYNEHGIIDRSPKYWTNRNQIEAEFFILNEFIKELNLSGFYIPNEETLNIYNSITSYIEFLNNIGRGKAWPTKEYLGILSIAQHYGLPTRYIDFTYDPLVALYFAAKSSINKKSKKIAIFALNQRAYNISNYNFSQIKDITMDEKYAVNEKKFYQVVNTPSYYNKNLKAQKALFLSFVHYGFQANDQFKPYSIEDYIQNSKFTKENYKFIIDSKFSKEILYLLEKRFYNVSTLFPSIESCIKNTFDKLNIQVFH